jgi:hypothetical protein
MLRISALLSIVVGIVLTIKTVVGFSDAYKYALSGEESYMAQRFALQIAFALLPVAGGAFALWREWRTLLAASWGTILGLAAPHLIRPPIPAAAMQMVTAHGGKVWAPGADIGELIVVVLALAGLVLCGLSESRRPSPN